MMIIITKKHQSKGGVLVESRINMSHQCALAAKKGSITLDCARISLDSMPREMIDFLPPSDICDTRSGVLQPVLVSLP